MRGPRHRWSYPTLLTAALALCAGPAWAGQLMPPQTTLRVAVVQFVPSTGNYRSWDAFDGEYVVGADGTIVLPSLGPIPVGDTGPQELAAKISDGLQKKLGLVLRPDTTVQVVGYPPIYVVGGVQSPGEYPFRQGMTVLQAIAVSGGESRGDDATNSRDDSITLGASLQKAANGILRSTARIARLSAELAGADEITFPPELDPKNPTIAQMLLQEKTTFQARRNEVERQTAALKDLGDLYETELKVLAEKVTALDEQMAKANAELERVTGLVKDGMATNARQSEVEGRVNNLRWDRLDNMVATMRAREGQSETKRNIAKLEDDRRSEVSASLQQDQATLEQLQLDQVTALAQLKQAEAMPTLLAGQLATMKVSYSIVRQQDGAVTEIPAGEYTELLPGDLVKVNVEFSTPLTAPAEVQATSFATN